MLQAGGCRFAKRLSLAKRHKFLGTESEMAAQKVPLPGMSGWSHCKLREITAPSQLGNHYRSFWWERQLRYYHVTSRTISLLQKDQLKSCLAQVWRQEPEGLVVSVCTQTPHSAACPGGTGAGRCLSVLPGDKSPLLKTALAQPLCSQQGTSRPGKVADTHSHPSSEAM